MHDSFNGWKRKTGLGTLFIATVFILAWIMSYFNYGAADVGGARLTSTSGSLQIVYLSPANDSENYVSHLLCWALPYWTIVGPLVLLSGLLLLWKPDERNVP